MTRLLLEVRAGGADDETEERIHGVMDRLTGWCHVSNHIKTKSPNPPAEDTSLPPVDHPTTEAPPWPQPK